jgi:CHAD domain-containing protein
MASRLRLVWDESAAPEADARRLLPKFVAAYFALVRKALHEGASPAALHSVRLATKHVRYTLELFEPCYGPGFKERLSELKKLQTVLGAVSDLTATVALLEKRLPEGPRRAALTGALSARSHEKAAEFKRYWREVFDAPGREVVWVRYLARHSRPPSCA